MSIHRFRLDDPRREVLLPERPENRYEGDGNQNVENDFAGLLVKNFASVRSQTDRRNVHKLFATCPKADRRNRHENAWQSKRDIRAMQARAFEKSDRRWQQFRNDAMRVRLVRFQKPGDQQRSDYRASVDREIEPVKKARQ